MKNIFLSIFCAAIIHFSYAQISPNRTIHFRNLGNDSINLSLNEEYYLIEDSCAQIVRHGYFKMKEKIFFGPFKDVSKANSNVIVSEGSYTNAGLKEGSFIIHYLNGNLQAKGNFKENILIGKWEFYYPDGKPRLIFEVLDTEIKIAEAWDDKGKKIINDGNGYYSAFSGNIVWTGKLNNGKPEGIWKAMDVNDRTNTVLVKEIFKAGKLQKGSSQGGEYKDESRIAFINETDFLFINAEKMIISAMPCNGAKRKEVVNAQYRGGFNTFSQKISDIVASYLNTVDLTPYNVEFEITGEISAKGDISRLSYLRGFDEKIASGLVKELMRLPRLEPALIDGKPVSQKIVFIFQFMSGAYRFNYRFLPLNVN